MKKEQTIRPEFKNVYDAWEKGLKYDALKKRNDELVEALKTIKDAFWSEGEPLQDRIADLKSIANQALKNNSK